MYFLHNNVTVINQLKNLDKNWLLRKEKSKHLDIAKEK